MTQDVYLDHAATTPLREDVVKAMLPYLTKEYGNPGSFNALGMRARDAVESARGVVSRMLHAKTSEIIFTSGGTESNNLALKGVMKGNREKGNHLITTTIEHPSVLETCKYLEKHEGCKVTYVAVTRQGIVDVDALEEAIRKDTVLISVMYANNDLGTIQPLAALGKIARDHGIFFHTDACQAGLLDLDVNTLQADLLTLNGSKLHGPKGSGVLYRRTGVPLHPLFHGGGQEWKLRSGTENVAAIVGFAKALELTQQGREQETPRLARLRDMLVAGILESIPRAHINGHPTQRLPHHASITFAGVDVEAMLLALSEQGIYASAGSACSSRKAGPSPALLATGMKEKEAEGTLRFTLGNSTTEEQVRYVLSVLPDMVKKLRAVTQR